MTIKTNNVEVVNMEKDFRTVMTKTKRTLQKMKLVLHNLQHQNAIVVERVPTV